MKLGLYFPHRNAGHLRGQMKRMVHREISPVVQLVDLDTGEVLGEPLGVEVNGYDHLTQVSLQFEMVGAPCGVNDIDVTSLKASTLTGTVMSLG